MILSFKCLGLARLTIIKCFNAFKCSRRGWIKGKAAKIRAGCSHFEALVQGNRGQIRGKDRLGLLVQVVRRIGRQRLYRLRTVCVELGILITGHISSNPLIFFVRDLGCGKPAALGFETIHTDGILRQIELPAKQWPCRSLGIELGGVLEHSIHANAALAERLDQNIRHLTRWVAELV